MYKTVILGKQLKGSYNELAEVVRNSGFLGVKIEKI